MLKLETAHIPITLTGREWAALCVQFVLNESLSKESSEVASRAKLKILQGVYNAAKALGPEPAPKPPAPARRGLAKRLAVAALVMVLLLLGAHLAAAQPPGLWDHNGSAMRLVYANGNGNFGVYYEIVRPELVETIPPGAPRFEGQRIGNQIVGNAFVYTKYCPGLSFPYPVGGIVYDEGVIELFGPAAVVDPFTCSIVGYRPNSDNAHIVFRLVQPVVAALPPPPPPVASNHRGQSERREELKRQGREFCREFPNDQVCNGR